MNKTLLYTPTSKQTRLNFWDALIICSCWFSDSPEAAGFGDQMPLGLRFSNPFRPAFGIHPASCTMGTGSPSWGESSWCTALTTHSYLGPRFKKQQSSTVTHHLGLMACFSVKSTFTTSHEKETDLKQKRRKLHKFMINKTLRNKIRKNAKVTQRQAWLENCMALINYSHDISVT